MQPDITNMLGETEAPEEENPLKNLEEASKEAGKKPKKSKEDLENFDDETFNQILMAGDNSEGLFTPDENKEEEKENPRHAEVDEDAKVKQVKVKGAKGKYANKFKEDITKNPQDYKVQTPKGEMTIAEAMRKGYNPITKRFEKDKSPEEVKKKHLEGLNDADKAKLEELTSPSAAHIAPKDAQAMGLPGDSPMIDGNVPQPTGQPMPPQEAMTVPQGATQVPPEGAPQGGLDINALLGGGN